MTDDVTHEVRHLREAMASTALALFALAARLRRKGQINESQELERLAIELQDIIHPPKPEGGTDYDERGTPRPRRRNRK
jgi:hypothetical protein